MAESDWPDSAPKQPQQSEEAESGATRELMPAATATSSSLSTTVFCAKTVSEPEILLRPCREQRSGSPDRISWAYYSCLAGMAEEDRRPCPKGTGFCPREGNC